MLKKSIGFSILFFLIFLAFQFLIVFFKTEHEVDYLLKVDDSEYSIKENFSKKNKSEYYLFKIVKDGDNDFYFQQDNDFNKQKQVVKSVVYEKINDIECMALIFKDDSYTEVPVCKRGSNYYSYNYFKYNYDLSSFLNKIPNFKSSINRTSNEETQNDITINLGYLDDNETLAIYNLKNIFIANNKKITSMIFSNLDVYKNEFGYKVGNCYVIPFLSTSSDFGKILIYDIDKQYKYEIKLSERISKNSYINGVYDNKLYIFDKSNLKQIEIDPKEKISTVIADTEHDAFVYIDGIESHMSVYELNNEKIIFSEKKDDYKDLKYDKIYQFDNFYIYSLNGNFYKVYKEYLDKPILLFSDINATNVKVLENAIYYVSGDSIYKQDKYGILKLATRKEFKYNSDNIFEVFVN